MVELDVLGVRMEVPTTSPVLILKESGGSRCLSIWIGTAEASAIVAALEGDVPPRPLTHDLIADILSAMGHTKLEGRITGVEEGTYFADLVIDEQIVSARPSDVVAIAIRAGFRVSCPSELLDQVGVRLIEPAEEEVERFREFLDSVTPDDFDPDDFKRNSD